MLIISCSLSEESNQMESNYEYLFQKVGQIREQRGSIPLNFLVKDFNIEQIDFSKHIGIRNTGIDSIAIQVKYDYIHITIFTYLDNYNRISLKAYPEDNGFYTQMTTQEGDTYYFHKNFETESDLFQHRSPSGKIDSFNSLDEDLLKKYLEPLTILYRITSEVLFTIKESYYAFLGSKLPKSYFYNNTESRYNTALNSHCEIWPSIYMVETGWSNSYNTHVLEGNLHASCMNQYCIGCCQIDIEPECLLSNTLCLIRGFGWRCDSFPIEGGGCPPHRPCINE